MHFMTHLMKFLLRKEKSLLKSLKLSIFNKNVYQWIAVSNVFLGEINSVEVCQVEMLIANVKRQHALNDNKIKDHRLFQGCHHN